MKVGLIVPIHGPFKGEDPTTRSYAETKAIYQAIEAEGLDSAWITDHLLFRFPDKHNIHSHEAFTFWSGLAEATSRIELGSLVLCMPFRNPAYLAKLAVSLDDVAQHRVTLGVGCGWHEPEFTAFGYPFDNRVSRFEEAMQILHPLLRTGHVDFRGKYHQAIDCDLVPADTRPGGIPIMIASTQPRMMDLTAQFADQWNGAWFGEVSMYQERAADLDAACERVGRDPKTLLKTAGVSIRFQDDVEPAPAEGPVKVLAGPVQYIAEQLSAYAETDCGHFIGNLADLTVEGIGKFAESAKSAGLISR
jgi:alkanesulfonate monooxygenase SsuD/methylene tetrahydromethanopterin reductase-like flavin-dependent oxidoreductase (luciferase family)